MNEPWIMSVPVLSTAHVPSPFEPERLSHQGHHPIATSDDDEDMFIYIGSVKDGNEYEGDNAWLLPVSRWLDERTYLTGRWVRFHSCGDVIDELPTFNWE